MFDLFNRKDNNEKELISQEQNFNREQNTFYEGSRSEEIDYYERENRSDLIRWQQESNPELKELVKELLGYTEQNGKWVKSYKGMCNELFINEVVYPHVKPYLDKVMANTKMDAEHIRMSLKNNSRVLRKTIGDNYDKYDMEFLNWNTVLHSIKTRCSAGAHRSLGGFTKLSDSSIIKVIDAKNQQVNPENKKGWGIFNKN